MVAVTLAFVPRALASISWQPRLASLTPPISSAGDPPVVINTPATPTTQATLSPTPAYRVGAWMAKDVTGSDGTDTIYVQVTRGADLGPAPGIAVTAAVTFSCGRGGATRGYGPAVTGKDGVATLTIQFAGLPAGRPVCVLVTAHSSAGNFTATTAFVAA